MELISTCVELAARIVAYEGMIRFRRLREARVWTIVSVRHDPGFIASGRLDRDSSGLNKSAVDQHLGISSRVRYKK